MRLIFMGTPDFAVRPLEALVAAGHDVACVYTQPPRPAGRGRQPRRGPVQARAEALGLPVRCPANFRDEAARGGFAALEAELAVVVAYGLILPAAVLAAPRRGCLNLHASLLPRWRGAAPIQRAILAGDAQTGVCAMQMEAGLDTGPVLLCEAVAIGPQDTAGALHDRLAEAAARLIVEVLHRIDALGAWPQPDQGAVYAAKIAKAEAHVDWTRPSDEIDRQIRALSPSPGAWAGIAGERVRLLMSEPAPGSGAPGTALDDALRIACGAGAVRLTRLQRAGRAAMDAPTFLRGFAVPAGSRLI